MKRLWLQCAGYLLGSIALVPAAEAGCAQFKVTGTNDCLGLSVSADLSKCDNARSPSPPVTNCNADRAIVLVRTERTTYLGYAVLGPEKAGARAWTLSGEVADLREVAPGPMASSIKSGQQPAASGGKGRAVSSYHRPEAPVLASSPQGQLGVRLAARDSTPAKEGLDAKEAPKAEARGSDSSPPASASAAGAPAAGFNRLTISGTADVYYSYNFNNPRAAPPPAPTTANAQSTYHGVDNTQTPLRNFDSRHNTFALNLVELAIKKTTDEMSLRLEFDYGDTADLTHRDANNTVDETSKNIGQAILSWTPKAAHGLSLNVGKMATHMGYETTKAKDNWQYSRSFIYALAIPYWHTGASLVYAPIELISASLFVYNGWNSTTEVNSGKTLGLQLALTPVSGFTITYNVIGGPERQNNDKDKLVVHEGIIAWTISPSWSTAIDYVNGSFERTKKAGTSFATGHWQGATVAVKYAPSAKYYISPRLESYWDRDGVTSGAAQVLHEATLTNSYMLAEGLETRLEVRVDQSNKETFSKGDEAKKSQATATMGLLASF